MDMYINSLCLIAVVVVPIHRPHTPTPAPLRTPTMASVTHPARTPTVRKIALISFDTEKLMLCGNVFFKSNFACLMPLLCHHPLEFFVRLRITGV